MPSRIVSACAAVVVSAIVSACGGTAPTATTSSPAPSPSAVASATPVATPIATPSAPAGIVINVAMTRFGDVLVDASGRTLYLFVADKGTSSACYGSCAQIWPPVVTKGAPQPGAGVSGSLLGTTQRTDGSVEVTYAGHPLYYFISDKKAGDTTGQAVDGFGGPWYVVAPSGAAIK